MAEQSTYGKTCCHFCGKYVCSNGFARVSHFRKHVREGIAFEIGRDHPDYRGQLEFVNPTYELERQAGLI